MEQVEAILQSIALPILLPEHAFAYFGNQRRLDIESLVAQLPQQLRYCIDLEATALQSGNDEQRIFILPLTNGNHLKLKVVEWFIVEIEVL